MNDYTFCISSKNPTHHLIDNIKSLYRLYTNPVIHIIDSDSENFVKYKEVENKFPDVCIHFIKNKNYEIGAWKYALENIPANNYVCIQDTLFLNEKINFDFKLYDVYYFGCQVGFRHCEGEKYFKELEYLVKDTVYEKYCINYFKDTSFDITTHTSFAIKRECLENIISNIKHLPLHKMHSQLTERVMALLFKFHDYKTYSFPREGSIWSKIHGSRA